MRGERRVVWAATALLLWGGAGLVLEATRSVGRPERSPYAYPSLWLPGSPAAERLGEFLRLVDAEVPAGAFVAVDSSSLSGGEQHFLRMWCAYLLPRQRVVHRGQVPDDVEPSYLVSYPGIDDASDGTTALLRSEIASLHRVERR